MVSCLPPRPDTSACCAAQRGPEEPIFVQVSSLQLQKPPFLLATTLPGLGYGKVYTPQRAPKRVQYYPLTIAQAHAQSYAKPERVRTTHGRLRQYCSTVPSAKYDRLGQIGVPIAQTSIPDSLDSMMIFSMRILLDILCQLKHRRVHINTDFMTS